MSTIFGFCVVSTNNSYVYKAIITLLSVKQKHNGSHFRYFICGNFSEKYIKIISDYGIEVLNISLENVFVNTKEFSWPKECFYTSIIPKKLYNLGIDYSIVLDGDILCINPIDINEILGVQELAFCPTLPLGDNSFLNNNKVKREFGLSEKDLEQYQINSGVGIYNNSFLVTHKYFEEFICFYRRLSKLIYFEGDQEIIDLLITKKYNNLYLHHKWNFFGWNRKNTKITGKISGNDIVFVHYVEYKPWQATFFWDQHMKTDKEYDNIRKKYKRIYVDFAKKTFGLRYYQYFFFDIIPLKKMYFKGVNSVLEKLRMKAFIKKILKIDKK